MSFKTLKWSSSWLRSCRLSVLPDFDLSSWLPWTKTGHEPVATRPTATQLVARNHVVSCCSHAASRALDGHDRETPCDCPEDRSQSPSVENQPVSYVSSYIKSLYNIKYCNICLFFFSNFLRLKHIFVLIFSLVTVVVIAII